MLDIIKRIMAFLLPVIKTAAIQTAADEINKIAYPRRPRTPYTSYSPRPRRMYEREQGVIKIAFDITGPSPAFMGQWLLEQMPSPGDHKDGIHIKSVRLDND